jgi:hypothetical protein
MGKQARHNQQEAPMETAKPRTRRHHAVFIRLNDTEHTGLEFLRERESLPAAQLIRRLLIKEMRAGYQAGESVMIVK